MNKNCPDFILFIIFDYLDYDHLLKARAVCKRWYWLIARSYKTRELVIRDEHEVSNPNWYYTFKPINIKLTVHSTRKYYLDCPSFLNLFHDLKYLKAYLKSDSDFEKLNKLTELEILELSNLIVLNDYRRLNLLKLKILKVNVNGYKLIIKSHQLRVLCAHELQNIELFYPQTLKYLELNLTLNFNESLNCFKFLEVYKCNDILLFDPNILRRSPKTLKEVHFYYPYKELMVNAISDIELMLEQKMELKMYQLRIFLKGVELINQNDHRMVDPDDLEKNDHDHGYLHLFFKYYNQLEDTCEFFTSINYTDLMLKFNNTLPRNFFKKFNNIQEVRSIKNENEKEFLSFLKKCRNLSKLNLEYPSFTQNFYENLPYKCKLLATIHLMEKESIKLDYSFITKLKLFKKLETNHEINLKTIRDILMKIKFIHSLKFRFKDNTIQISKNSINGISSFTLKKGNFEYSKLDYDELIHYCKNIEFKSSTNSKLHISKRRYSNYN